MKRTIFALLVAGMMGVAMQEQDMKKACKEQLKANMGNPAEPVTPAH